MPSDLEPEVLARGQHLAAERAPERAVVLGAVHGLVPARADARRRAEPARAGNSRHAQLNIST
jgi:hypothetical protein